ncbi:uncharacterized protein LOC135089012 isoform X5 [Scylla paramamosain]|uniref:uncharacterized protein LOC135089012 isoform X5 n=1 Tax=Scylla paramamosain TaxID=85552 RepID=UPI003082FC1C
MLEVLVLGVVGLAYTCVQTLFFLNCLNSRRRERRRLERVFRNSLRTVKAPSGKETHRSHERHEAEVSPAVRNENGTAAEQVTCSNTNTTAGRCEGRLVTRLVVKSGKEAAPGSHEGVSADPRYVRVQNVIVHHGEPGVEAGRESASAGLDSPPRQPASVSLDHHGGTTAAPEGAVNTITVNSNMIQVSGDAHPLLPPAYESLEGEPMSILTQVTTLGEDSGDGRHTPPDYSCIAEEDMEAPLQDLSLGGGQGPVDLLGTISQILRSPPESMEPGSEAVHLYEAPTEVPPLSPAPQHVVSQVGGGEEVSWRMTLSSEDFHAAPPPPWASVSRPDVPLPRDTWTLPRPCRRVTPSHGSLPRPREKLSVAHAAEGKLSSRLTPPRPTSVHPAGRDEALRAGGAARGTITFQLDSAPPSDDTSPPLATPRTASSDPIASRREAASDGENSDSEVSEPPPAGHSDEQGGGTAVTEHSEAPDAHHGKQPSGYEPDVKAAVYEPPEDDLPSPAMAAPLRQPEGGGEAGCAGDNIYEEIKEDLPLHVAEDRDSVASEVQYENISESDTHADSGYESPVKADIHSSDDAASTSSGSSHDHHYEDINPTHLPEGRPRDSSTLRRSRSKQDVVDEDDEAARQRQRLQGLDDLIAGVPPPDYDRGAPLSDESARPDVCNSGSQGDIPPPAEFGDDDDGEEEATGRQRLHSTHSMPPTSSHSHGRTPVSRTNSEPPPPPPPPMPDTATSPRQSPSSSHRSAEEANGISPASSKPPSPRSAHSSVEEREEEEDHVDEGLGGSPSSFVRRNSQRSLNGERPSSLPLDMAEHYGKIMADGREREVAASNEELGHSPQLGKSHLMHGKTLPFIPPKFPTQPSDSGLIKPSEYLRSLGESTIARSPSGEAKAGHGSHQTGTLHHNGTSHQISTANHNGTSHYSGITPLSAATHHSDTEHDSGSAHHTITEEIDTHDASNGSASVIPPPLPAIPESSEEDPATKDIGNGAPPPPPAPPAPPTSSSFNTMSSTRTNTLNTNHSNNNTLSHNSNKTVLPTISVTDLQSVQLRKIETKSVKPTSIALKLPVSPPEPLINSVKNDVIAELKMGVDIPGIKKLKSERAKEEEIHIRQEKEELSRQFSASKFVDQVPDTDPSGNRIPDWKRQMLARKAAERAKKEAEEQRLQEAEEKRLQSIPPWKRQLMMRREDDARRAPLYVPKVEEVKRIKVTNIGHQDSPQPSERTQEKESTAGGSSRTTTTTTITATISSTHTRSPIDTRQEEDEEPPNPWRTNLRKTNSKLNLHE